jgi:NAD-dependent dihydropyrimidine dehydrogenase PreA subunit
MSANIEINLDECTSCGTCVKACFVDVIRWDDAEEKPTVAYERDCVWCFTCEINCPTQCINVIPQMPGQLVNPF